LEVELLKNSFADFENRRYAILYRLQITKNNNPIIMIKFTVKASFISSAFRWGPFINWIERIVIIIIKLPNPRTTKVLSIICIVFDFLFALFRLLPVNHSATMNATNNSPIPIIEACSFGVLGAKKNPFDNINMRYVGIIRLIARI